MEKSEKQDKILPALFEARQAFEKIKQSRLTERTMGGKPFATLEDIHAAVIPALMNNGVMMTSETSEDGQTLHLHLEHASSGQYRIYKRRIHNWNEMKKQNGADYATPLPLADFDAIRWQKAVTYTQRQATLAACGIAEGDDAMTLDMTKAPEAAPERSAPKNAKRAPGQTAANAKLSDDELAYLERFKGALDNAADHKALGALWSTAQADAAKRGASAALKTEMKSAQMNRSNALSTHRGPAAAYQNPPQGEISEDEFYGQFERPAPVANGAHHA